MTLFSDVGSSTTINHLNSEDKVIFVARSNSCVWSVIATVVPYMNPFSIQVDAHREQIHEVFIIFKNFFTN